MTAGGEMPEAEVLLGHLERDLGPYTGRGVGTRDWDLPFSLLQFPDRPRSGVDATVTFGVSTHVFEGGDGRPRRQELLTTLLSELDAAAVDIAANVGGYVLERHVALLEGESIAMPTRAGSRLDALVATRPEPFPDRLARCEDVEGGVEIVWLLPCARTELHITKEHGVPDLLRAIGERGEDPYDLARTPVL